LVEKLGVDLLTLDAGKVYGPRGMGCLYVKRGIPIRATTYGGGQEKGLRSGTENVPGIAGFAKAVTLAVEERIEETDRIKTLRDMFINELKEIRPDIQVNGGDEDMQSPHIANVSIPGIDNEFFLFQLDARGIACSTKSSCLRDAEESYVLRAMKVDSGTSLRFSFGRWTTKGDIRAATKAIRSVFF
jgi:cysteine desulfurase